MNREEIINYWKEISEYDIESARAMLETKRYLYVGFMCHQTIEKIFKGYYFSKKMEIAPYTHNLMKLAKSGGFADELTEPQKDFLDILEPLNIEARYPSYKESLLKELTKEKCAEILKKTEDFQKWIKEKF